jgi:thiamine biosynthesis protein ThiI
LSQLYFDTVIVRFGGEIGIKAEWTRKLYERRLMTNIKAVLKEDSLSYAAFLRKFGRIYIKTSRAEATAEKLRRVFGISSLSPSVEISSNLDDILRASLDLAASEFKQGKKFSVRCHRIGKHPYTSQDVCRQVGQSLLTQLPSLKLKVNLSHPEQTLHIEVREDKAYVYTKIVTGPGGLPLGTQPTLVNLLNCDMASAAACWLTMKRGCPPILVHYENKGSTNTPDIKKTIDTAKRLMEWSVGFPRNLYLIEPNYGSDRRGEKYSQKTAALLQKRLMLRIAQRLGIMKKAEGIVTGDTINKTSKHTIHTFRLQDEATDGYPIYRPLLGKDTHEIQKLAQSIILETTAGKIKRKEPLESGIELQEVHRIEKEMNTDQMVEDALESLKVLRI